MIAVLNDDCERLKTVLAAPAPTALGGSVGRGANGLNPPTAFARRWRRRRRHRRATGRVSASGADRLPPRCSTLRFHRAGWRSARDRSAGYARRTARPGAGVHCGRGRGQNRRDPAGLLDVRHGIDGVARRDQLRAGEQRLLGHVVMGFSVVSAVSWPPAAPAAARWSGWSSVSVIRMLATRSGRAGTSSRPDEPMADEAVHSG